MGLQTVSTVRTTNLQNPSSSINNVVLNTNGTVSFGSGVLFPDGNLLSSFATTTDIAGITVPTGVITSGTAQLALSGTTNQGSIGSGFYVTGPGIPPGTTVVSGAGTFVLGLSQNANAVGLTPLAQGKPYTFYNNTAVVSPGVIGGQLCRAWVNFDGNTIAGTGSASGIRASYNVSSITDNGAGKYTLNFRNALPDTNYLIIATNGSTGSTSSTGLCGIGLASSTSYNNKTTSNVDVWNLAANNAAFIDNFDTNIAVFR